MAMRPGERSPCHVVVLLASAKSAVADEADKARVLGTFTRDVPRIEPIERGDEVGLVVVLHPDQAVVRIELDQTRYCVVKPLSFR